MPKTFRCEICGKILTRSTVLLDHMRGVHWGDKPHVCKHTGCSRSFTRRPDLLQHEKLHTGSSWYLCERTASDGTQYGCGKTFSRERDLARHQNRRTGVKCRVPQSPRQDTAEMTKHPKNSSVASVHPHSVRTLMPQSTTEIGIVSNGDGLAITEDILTSGPKLLLPETDTAQRPEEWTAQVQTKPSWDVNTRTVDTARGASACDDIGDRSYAPCVWYDEVWKSPPRREMCSEYLAGRCKDVIVTGLSSDSNFKYLISSLWHRKQAVKIPVLRKITALLGPGTHLTEGLRYPCLHQLIQLEQLPWSDGTFEQIERPQVTTDTLTGGSVLFTFRTANIDTMIDTFIFAQVSSRTEIYEDLGTLLFSVLRFQQSQEFADVLDYNDNERWNMLYPEGLMIAYVVDHKAKETTTGPSMSEIYMRLQCLTKGFLSAWKTMSDDT